MCLMLPMDMKSKMLLKTRVIKTKVPANKEYPKTIMEKLKIHKHRGVVVEEIWFIKQLVLK